MMFLILLAREYYFWHGNISLWIYDKWVHSMGERSEPVPVQMGAKWSIPCLISINYCIICFLHYKTTCKAFLIAFGVHRLGKVNFRADPNNTQKCFMPEHLIYIGWTATSLLNPNMKMERRKKVVGPQNQEWIAHSRGFMVLGFSSELVIARNLSSSTGNKKKEGFSGCQLG
jgi:hypothetical protein